MSTLWTPDSWKNFPIKQQPTWTDQQEVDDTLKRISELPPLVFAGEIRSLKQELAKVQRGEAFLLQGGDCAEDFSRCNAVSIRENLKIILQMGVALTFGANKPVVKIGRVAGQYAKPRSSDTEMIDGVEYPSFRGDIVNAPDVCQTARRPDPKRMLEAYFHSTATLNLLRAFVHGGFADLNKVHLWNKEFVAKSPQGQRYEKLAAKIDNALDFMHACGVADLRELREVDLYTSHEALLLGYEQALTRQDSLTGDFYDCSAHMIWIGDRTRDLDGAHIEFFSGVKNPIGMKVGPTMQEDELIKIIDRLNPENEEGRMTLISRFGHDKIEEMLPKLVKRVRDEGRNVLWSCDPMHGNTYTSSTKYKTRNFDHIASEVRSFFHVHGEAGTVPGGIHFEMTGEDVTEVVGGAQQITDQHLEKCYMSKCDPRLNGQQSLEMAFELAEMLGK